MPRHAQSIADLYNYDWTLVMYNGAPHVILGVEGGSVRLAPASAIEGLDDGDESAAPAGFTVPVREIVLPDPVTPEPDELRAVFRLDVLPWALAEQGRWPFRHDAGTFSVTEDDLLILTDRLSRRPNSFLLDAWLETFDDADGNCLHARMASPDEPGFTPAFLLRAVCMEMSFLDMGDPDDTLARIAEIRDAYLQSRGKSLSEMVVPDFLRGEMLSSLEAYAGEHPVTEELREAYTRLLEADFKSGGADGAERYAYAYYGGNGIVPCDWKKSETALRELFDPDVRPPRGLDYAANSLGYIYASSRLGQPDYARALICFSYAAEAGIIEATYKLSDMFRLGQGVERDPERAWALLYRLYRQADKLHLGNGKYADIVLRMGYCYRDGVGVPVDRVKARGYFQEAQRAIEKRLKIHPQYGDSVVAKNIAAALESVRD